MEPRIQYAQTTDGVSIAAESGSGEVLVSQTVRDLARTSAGVTFDDRGEHELKGVADPQRLFAVRGGGG